MLMIKPFPLPCHFSVFLALVSTIDLPNVSAAPPPKPSSGSSPQSANIEASSSAPASIRLNEKGRPVLDPNLNEEWKKTKKETVETLHGANVEATKSINEHGRHLRQLSVQHPHRNWKYLYYGNRVKDGTSTEQDKHQRKAAILYGKLLKLQPKFEEMGDAHRAASAKMHRSHALAAGGMSMLNTDETIGHKMENVDVALGKLAGFQRSANKVHAEREENFPSSKRNARVQGETEQSSPKHYARPVPFPDAKSSKREVK